jgi:predicted ArsR family transcriptional regulator
MLDEKELEAVLHPFYRHHVMIQKSDFESHLERLKAEFKPGKVEASENEARSRGRPSKVPEALDVYKTHFPNGHGTSTHIQIAAVISANHGPKLSVRSVGRMLSEVAKKDRQNQS